MRIPSLLAVLTLVALPAGLAAAPPKKNPGAGKSPPACGVKVLPLVVGNTWTYVSVPSPTEVRFDLSRIVPNPAKKVVVTVKTVETKGTETVATLEELSTYEVPDPKAKQPRTMDTKMTTTITCSKTKFEISPESFFFSGEPGGMLGMTFDKLERKKGPNLIESDLKLTPQGTIGDQKWREDIAAHWKRVPHKGADAKLGSGRLEIERSFTPATPEDVTLKTGTYTKADHLFLLITGRVYLDDAISPEGKPCMVRMLDGGKDKDGNPTFKDVANANCDMPAGWTNEIWLAEDIGVIQAKNMYAHMYQLSELSLK